MSVTSYLLFFFSALGVFNGLLLASWLLIRPNKQVADGWLAILLLLLSVRIGKSVAFYFTPGLDKNILQLGLTACFLIGPCMVAYIIEQVKCNPLQSVVKWSVFGLSTFIVVLGIILPYQSNLELWQFWVYRGSSFFWLFCLALSFFLYKSQIQMHKGKWQELLTDRAFITLIGCTLIWFAYFSASYTSYIMGALSFSLVLYLSLLMLIKTNRKQPTVQNKYANNKLSDDQKTQYAMALEQLIKQEQVYIDPQLSLPRLAKRLNMPHTVLSQLLNDHYQMNFKQYINAARVRYAQTLLLSKPKASIDDIAEQSGFTASSTFYNAFKQQTGMTPNRFRTTKL
jgi:AraC-like DNA-binding protein